MMRHNLILELAAWGFDESPERPLALLNGAQARAEEVLARRQASEACPAIAHDIPDGLQEMLGRIAEREDIQAEFHGFEWEIGVVDLRMLVSFQRRLALRDDFFKNNDIVPWPSRIHIAFPRRRNSQVAHMLSHNALTLSSENPDFSVRLRAEANEASEFGLTIHHGSPFMEVGVYRDRWFLRDGYHRAYSLLQAGVFEIPAVIVHAKTLEELGANRPWFFPEQVLFSARPPLVADFQCDDLVLRWRRPARRKVVRITITEEFEPSCPEEEGRTEYEYCNQAR